ncbi:MAG: hypothetical protein EA399_07800 [Desulfovibrionales bacterium]|nr:MAG: hypothetical protein EA399_07800 [Desulfovibrionales bacterium]
MHGVAPGITTTACEFLVLALRGFVTLHADGRGGLWWSASAYKDDPGSLGSLADLCCKSWPDLFRLLESGDLEHLLDMQTTSTTPDLPLKRTRKKRISKEMVERFRKARPWIEGRLPELEVKGWTRRTLYRVGRHPYPFSSWGLAWSSGWLDAIPGMDEAGNVTWTRYDGNGQVRVLKSYPGACLGWEGKDAEN